MGRMSQQAMSRVINRWLEEFWHSRTPHEDRTFFAGVLFAAILAQMPKQRRPVAMHDMMAAMSAADDEAFAAAYLGMREWLDADYGVDQSRH